MNKAGLLQCVAGDFPRRIEMELASACNLRCVYCPRKHVEGLNGFMEYSLFKRLVDEIAAHPEVILVLHRRGETLLHPRFSEICRYIRGKFKEVQLATNATLLDETRSRAIIEAVSFISFSIDVPEVFNKTRIPARYDQVEESILSFLELNKGRVRTQVTMVKTPETPPENTGLFKEIWSGKVDRIRIYEEHSRDGKFGSLVAGRGGRKPCVMPSYEMLIYYDGKTGRCNHDWDGVPLGSVIHSTIKEIWHCPQYEDLRSQHESLDIRDEVCKNCDSWYAEINRQGTGETIEAEK